MTIGERLEDARKRKGISIREAAEATKIRGDYLLAMEDDSFKIDLPEIYVRGFLRNYAKFLHLEEKKLMTDYEAFQYGAMKAAPKRDGMPRDGSRTLGHMDIPPKPVSRGEDDEAKPATRRSAGTVIDDDLREDDEDPAGGLSGEASLYIKAGIVGGVVIVALIVVLVLALGRGGDDEPTNDVLVDDTPPIEVIQPQELVLMAQDRVSVIVTSVQTGDEIFAGIIPVGERRTITKLGPVVISYSNGSNLFLNLDGLPLDADLNDGIGTLQLD